MGAKEKLFKDRGQSVLEALKGLDRRTTVGLVCALVAVLLILLYSQEVQSRAQESRADALARFGGEQVEVYVALRTLQPGEEIRQSDVELRTWVADLLPQDALTKEDVVVGATVSQAIYPDEPLLRSRLGTVGETMTVPEGLCAVSVPSKDVQAVGGAIAAGSQVDVYYVGDSGVTLLAQRVLVLETSTAQVSESSNSLTSTSSASLTWVTLAVAPEAVEELIAVSRTESLYLVLPGEGVSLGADGEIASQEDEVDAAGATDTEDAAVEAGDEGASPDAAGQQQDR